MATYATPPAADIRAWTGLNGDMLGLSTGALDTELALRVVDGEDEVFARVGVAQQTNAGLTAAQVRMLQRAVSHRTCVVVGNRVLSEKVTGTQEPLLMEDADSLRDWLDRQEERAEKLEGLFEGAGEAVDTKPMSRPRARSSTFTPSADRTPSGKLADLDEREDVFTGED